MPNYQYHKPKGNFHRLVLSRFPPVDLFDFADSPEEALAIAQLEGRTNERLVQNFGKVFPEDWIGGDGSTPVMAAFTHPGISRFTNGQFGAYYASNNVETAIAETRFHRERFLGASGEEPCQIHFREYRGTITKPLIDISTGDYDHLLDPDLRTYPTTQAFASEVRNEKEWGIFYPSLRNAGGENVAVLRPPAVSIPKQGSHYSYIWDGERITEVFKLKAT